MQKTVQLIRQNIGENVEVFLIGSRATKTHSPRSDFDFVFDAKEKVPIQILAHIRAATESFHTLKKIDIIDLHRTKEAFRRIAMRDAVRLTA